jgi:hypothetical protein
VKQYYLSSINNDNNEIINQLQIPGLYASVTDVSSKTNPIPPDYVSAVGIASIAFQDIDR